MGRMLAGLAAGAVGTESLNIATYLDVATRGRALSEVPATMVEKIAERTGVEILTKEDDTGANRRGGVGALLGYATGLSVGLAYGVVRPLIGWLPWPLRSIAVGAAAMAASDVPMALLKVSNPAEWAPSSWVADIVPHLAYGVATVLTYEGLAK